MSSITIHKKYLVIVPFFFGLMMLSGVMGIIYTSLTLSDSASVINHNDTSAEINVGEFDVSAVSIPSDWSRIEFDITVIIFEEGSLLTNNKTVDIYILEEKPSIEYGNNFTALEESSFFENNVVAFKPNTVTQAKLPVVEFDSSILYIVLANTNESPGEFYVQLSSRVANLNPQDNTTQVLAIIFVSLYTLGMLLLTIFTAIEVAEPGNYKAKLLTKELDGRIDSLAKEAEAWEIVIVLLAIFSFPIGAGMSMARQDNPLTIFAIIGIAFVYVNINKRIGYHGSIINILQVEREIQLPVLATRLAKREDDVKSAIFYLISHKKQPIRYNAKTNVVVYDGTAQSQPVETQPVVSTPLNQYVPVEEEKVEEELSVPLNCAYCGAEAIVNQAKFCAECGSSMVATK